MRPPALSSATVAILGYGNQGRAQALNLRDSGIRVLVGARSGRGADAARVDGFEVCDFGQAASKSQVLMFLLPDHVIPQVYRDLDAELAGRWIGFSHGFAVQFGGLRIEERAGYFMVSPKGAGVWLRKAFETKVFLPGVYAIGSTSPSQAARELALEYAAAIGVSQRYLRETTFQEEAECDLFGEQAVLCGGIPELIDQAFRILVEKGHSPEMAFFECCYEARLILDLMLQYGPAGMAERISPTAFFGGKTVGRRIIDDRTVTQMHSVFDDIRSGKFAADWLREAQIGMPRVTEWRKEIAQSPLQKTYDKLKSFIQE